ncbi:peptidyl-prolyl cis-trans isomerase [Bacteroides sp. 51]|uniref:peptidyl-prolyl cis-trans isomerase n=1 Tax=Bacteroides sp. 51 TaxID=2302938 RepID=UPI0013D39DA0|nr:peptidyl-prolyl cis-trans isomerase [Bacteroides sp. 51]NDV84424.1 peptidyl-prolyl cis-trans isomerase [Bacteroides sp. 51]
MRIIGLLLLFFLLCTSCGGQKGKHGRAENLLVEVDGNFLYKEDLQAVFPAGLSKDDSLLFAENYIRNWIEDVLLYGKAKANIPDNSEIDKLVENYRKALIVHTYQQELINQRLSPNLPEQDITDFYEKNKNLFVLERPLIKGLFIKIPLGAPQLNEVRRWYKTETHEAVESLEKYSLQHAMSYDYFYDKWVEVSDVLGKIPLKADSPEEYINANRHVELQDTAFYYFLNVTDYLKKGDEEPYDFARKTAKDMLINMRKVDFVKGVKTDLYNEATRKDKIIYNY